MHDKRVPPIGVRVGLAAVGALMLLGTAAGFGRTPIERHDTSCCSATRAPIVVSEALSAPTVAEPLITGLPAPAIGDGMTVGVRMADMTGVRGAGAPAARGRQPVHRSAHPRKSSVRPAAHSSARPA